MRFLFNSSVADALEGHDCWNRWQGVGMEQLRGADSSWAAEAELRGRSRVHEVFGGFVVEYGGGGGYGGVQRKVKWRWDSEAKEECRKS